MTDTLNFRTVCYFLTNLINDPSSLKLQSQWSKSNLNMMNIYEESTINFWIWGIYVCLMVFNATFNSISAISWRSVLLMEETGEPGENHRPVASHWQTYSWFELTTSVVICTDCISSCKSNYHKITVACPLLLYIKRSDEDVTPT